MWTRSVPNSQDKPEATSSTGLLSARLFNAIPYSSSVKGFYNRTKDYNDVIRIGLNFAENVVVSHPLTKRAEAIDRFASKQLTKLEDIVGVDLVTKSVGAVAYPIGYTYGMAQYARNKVMDMTTPALNLGYELADVLVDRLLPLDGSMMLSEDYVMSLPKNPVMRIKDRATINSLVRLPSNAFSLSWNMFYSTLYMGMGFATMSLDRMLRTANTLVDSINTNFDLTRPWTAVNSGDFTKLYKATLFYGAKYVNGLIDDIEHQASELSEYLNNSELPYNSKVMEFAANKLKGIERRLIKIGGIRFLPTEESIKMLPAPVATPAPVASEAPAVHAPRQRDQVELRPASVIIGSTVHEVDHINYRKADLLNHKVPSMMWGPEQPATRKNPFPNPPAEFNGEEILFKEESTPVKKSGKAKKVHHHKKPYVAEPAAPVEIKVEPAVEVNANADEHGYVQVKPSSHGHLIPMHTAQHLGEQLLRRNLPPVTPANSPADALNNPYAKIEVDDSSVLRGPEVEDVHAAKWRAVENRAHEKHPRSKALHELLLKLADIKDKEEKRAEAHSGTWERPKHAAHIHAEKATPEPKKDKLPAPKNNPFGKLSEVDASEDPFSMGISAM